MSKEIIYLKDAPSIISSGSVVGKKETEGPLGDYFDIHGEDDKFGQKTWELAESEMQHLALNIALSKKKLPPEDIEILLAGDLINQCTSSSYGLLDFKIPFFGLYGACSTAAEGLVLASMLTGFGIYKRAAVVSSSHFCSSERQFRFPLEYGGQRTPTSQWTVTGSGAFILDSSPSGPFITELCPGKIVDMGITDANNMGAAMAPAAADTLRRYFKASKLDPGSFDMIVTGDLGFEGHSIVASLLGDSGITLGENYTDCGLLIYDRERQDTHAGGSGCGCSAAVLSGYLLDRFRSKTLSDILFVGTGALMSPMSINQGCSIPGIAHLIRISAERKPPKAAE